MSWFNTWYLIRSAGIVSYLLLSLAIFCGLYGMIKRQRGESPGCLQFWHQSLANWSFYLALFHVLLLFFDSYTRFSWREILLPFQTTYKPLPMAFGIIGLYLLIVTMFTTELRTVLGIVFWKKLHMASPLVYLSVTAQGLLIGTDSTKPWLLYMYFGSLVIVVGLLVVRFSRSNRQSAPIFK